MINKAWHVFVFHLKQAWVTPRIPLLFLVVGIFVFSAVKPVSIFSADVGIAASPWAFPHITNDYICQLVIMATVILLFCDAPFQNGSHLYILPRAGNVAWNVGICLYIVALSFLYIVTILLASTLALVPHIGLYSGWGKIWGTLARTTASSQYGLTFSVNDYIIGAYTPFGATVTAFLLSWACCVWLGLVIYLLNDISNTMIGCLAAAAFVFLDITIWNEWSYLLYRISPVTMTQLSAISRQESLYGLSKAYAVWFFAISIVVLQGLCILIPSIRGRATRYEKGACK